MKRTLLLALTFVLLTVFAGSVLEAKKKSNSLLKGIGGKKRVSVSLLLRDDLKAAFKETMTAYLAEDTEKFLSYFSDKITMGSRKLHGKSVKTDKTTLAKRVKREFKRQDFTKVKFDEAFDLRSPRMVFVMSEAQMRDSIPVWGFAIEAKEIASYMKDGDYLVIANTLPEVSEKVMMPTSMYFIFRQNGKKFDIVGLD